MRNKKKWKKTNRPKRLIKTDPLYSNDGVLAFEFKFSLTGFNKLLGVARYIGTILALLKFSK